MRRILLVIPILYLAWAATAQAEETISYTLPDILRITIEKNPSLPEFEANMKAAEADIVAAAALPNPSLALEIGRGRATRESDLDRREFRISLEQPVEAPSKRLYRKKVAEAVQAATREDFNGLRFQLVLEVKDAFYRMLLAQRSLETASSIVAATGESLDRIKLRVEAGDAPEVELVKARVEFLKIQREHRAAGREVVGFRAALNRFTGNALNQDFAVSGDFPAAPANLDPERLTSLALTRHPSLEHQKTIIAREEASLALEQASRMGDLAVRAFYGQEIDKELYGAGVSIPLPVWYDRSGEIAAASAHIERARAALERLKTEIAGRVAQRTAELQAASARIDTFEDGLLRDARETLEIATFSFEQGETSLLELLDARRTYAAILREHNESLYELAMAVARLEQATGGNIHD